MIWSYCAFLKWVEINSEGAIFISRNCVFTRFLSNLHTLFGCTNIEKKILKTYLYEIRNTQEKILTHCAIPNRNQVLKIIYAN